MSAPLSLSGPLAGLRRHACSESFPVAPPHTFPGRGRHWSHGCRRCQMLLLLQAIDHLVPDPEVDDWLKRPNTDLDGRAPMECIDAGEYEPVFNALGLLAPGGPVS